MKTLSIKNPYAKLIARNIKDVENRTWKTNFRGKILIHVPKKLVPLEKAITKAQWDSLSYDDGIEISGDLETGCIIGSVEIIDCVKKHDSVWALPNHWHWVLDNAELFDYVYSNVKGKLSFWDFDTNNAAKITDDGINSWCACDNQQLNKFGVVRGLANCSNCGEAYYH